MFNFVRTRQTLSNWLYCFYSEEQWVFHYFPFSPAIGKRYVEVQFSPSVVNNSLPPHGWQHTRPPCPSPTPTVYSNSCPLSRWCHPAISSSVICFSSCLCHCFNLQFLNVIRCWTPFICLFVISVSSLVRWCFIYIVCFYFKLGCLFPCC